MEEKERLKTAEQKAEELKKKKEEEEKQRLKEEGEIDEDMEVYEIGSDSADEEYEF